MKILHINCNYIYSALHQKLLESLGGLGVDNHTFVATFNKELAEKQYPKDVEVTCCFNRNDRFLFDFKQNKILNKLETTNNIYGYDCIHAYTLFTDGNSARVLSKKYGIPYVVAIRNTDVNDFFKKRPLLRSRGVKILKDAEKVFFLSEVYRNMVIENFCPKELREEIINKSIVIPNGIDEYWLNNPNKKAEREQNDDVIRLIYAGRIDKNKNIQATQKVVEMLIADGYNASLEVIYSKVDDKAEFNKIKAHSHTNLISALPKEELINRYRQADIFVMPSFTESFGLVYAEAMSQGLPVLYSKGQGFDGQFEEGKVGYHVNPRSVDSIFEAVKKTLDNYNVISENARSSSEVFRWENISEEYLRVYSTIV